MAEKIEILKIKVSSVNCQNALEEVEKWLVGGSQKHYIMTPNPEILVAAQRNKELRESLNHADLALPDGVGLLWAGKVLGRPLKGRVTGTDFMEKLSEMAAKEGFTIGLIGGRGSVAVKSAECLKKMYPKLKVVLAQEEWGVNARSQSSHQDQKTASSLNNLGNYGFGISSNLSTKVASPYARSWISNTDSSLGKKKIDILFVAFGAPKQEIWIRKNLDKLPVRVAMGVGGAFDYFAGAVSRAPKWVQNLGLEWLYRLIRQPWRIKRQLSLIKFIWLVFKEKYER